MHFQQLRVRDFRNFSQLEAAFPDNPVFVLGDNGQGKTNLLEALSLVTSLRSFRTQDSSALLRWGSEPPEARLFFVMEHESLGSTELEIHLRNGSKRILLDGEPVRTLGEILGFFPTVTFSSQDIQLLRGAPGLRRRMVDLMLVLMDPGYYDVLTRYHQALRARNALLKQRAGLSQRRPFEDILVREGYELARRREGQMAAFNTHFQDAYRAISPVEEHPELLYQPSLSPGDPEAYARRFGERATRDQETGTTSLGPHRDDFRMLLQSHPAREFASEGQQRGLVLALRLGWVAWHRARGGVQPVILADDIVGELDPRRKRGFWECLGKDRQVIATGTRLPEEDPTHQWSVWRMQAGRIHLQPEFQS